jgi:oligopeptide/dipeptide ABC transporter ATP-binding protein
MPRLDADAQPERLTTIAGTVPSPDALPSGCTFRDRCPYAWERCAREEPALHQVGAAHRARCHLVQEPERRVLPVAGEVHA